MDWFENAEFMKLSTFITSIYRILIHNDKPDIPESRKLKGICGPNKRFPNGGIYINTSFGVFATVFSELYDFKPEDPLEFMRFVLVSALTHNKKVEDNNDVFDRTKFEKKFNLQWTNGIRWKRVILFSAAILLLFAIILSTQS